MRLSLTLILLGALTLSACAAPTSTPGPTLQPTETATPAPSATPTLIGPTPTPSFDYSTLSEEELAATVNEGVALAASAAEAVSTGASEAVADNTLSPEEATALRSSASEASAAIDEAFAALDAYNDVYGDLAEQTADALGDLENDLNELAVSLEVMTAQLDVIDAALAQGQAAGDAIAQLKAAAEQAQPIAASLETQSQVWLAALPAEWTSRADSALTVPPTDVASDRAAAIRSAFAYAQAVTIALSDGRVLKAELDVVAQLGANAVAGLTAHGGPALQNAIDAINALTAQLARGELPGAKAGLDGLNRLLPPLP